MKFSKYYEKGLIVVCLVLICIAFVYWTLDRAEYDQVCQVSYKEYYGLNGRFSYKLPQSWKVAEQEFGGGEILYHADFTSEDKTIHGFAQVWKLKTPLLEFLQQSKESAFNTELKDFTIEPVKIDGENAYVLQYSRIGKDEESIKAFEVFEADSADEFHRLAFYVDEADWKNEFRTLFLNTAGYAKLR